MIQKLSENTEDGFETRFEPNGIFATPFCLRFALLFFSTLVNLDTITNSTSISNDKVPNNKTTTTNYSACVVLQFYDNANSVKRKQLIR